MVPVAGVMPANVSSFISPPATDPDKHAPSVTGNKTADVVIATKFLRSTGGYGRRSGRNLLLSYSFKYFLCSSFMN